MSVFAITDSSYRQISSKDDVRAPETFSDVIPAALLAEIAKLEAKNRRTEILRATDWTQMGDAKLTGLEKAAWAVYRQALRDLPSVAGFPNVPWPTVPGVIVEADAFPKAGL